MIEEIINGIKYLLNEETLTAEVIQLKEDFKSDEDNFVEQFLQEDNMVISVISLYLRP